MLPIKANKPGAGLPAFLFAVCTLLVLGTAQAAEQGKLYLVSVGIGDPDNITVKAQKIIKQADLLIGGRRLTENFADLVQGKQVHEAGHGLFTPMQRRNMDDDKATAMEQKNRDLIRQAIKAGKTVAVVDYGDPMIFGPQTGYLQEFQDLNPVVVPGVSSFNASNAALARSVTSGKTSQSVILTSVGSARKDYKGTDPLARLAQTQSTIALFTMRVDLPLVVSQLKQHYPGDTPVAIVSHAGYSDKQQVLRATLDTVVDRVSDSDLPFEHMIYVGKFLQ